MRFAVLIALKLAVAGILVQAATQTASTATQGQNEEVTFLQTLQTAQVSSMSCLITLVNMTYSPIGTCLGLDTLAPLVISPPDNGTFSQQLESYLETVCGGTQCQDGDIAAAQSALSTACQGSKDTDLVKVLSAILDNYTNSFRTLACSVHFNGTTGLCLPATLNASTDANSNTFFTNLVTGTNLQQYQSSVFNETGCTGCVYEMYKAAVYTISGIRGNDMTKFIGDHLQQKCTNEDNVQWSNVQDQQIPDALQIQQSTTTASTSASRRRTGLTFTEGLWRADGLMMGTGMVMGGGAIILSSLPGVPL